MPVKFSRKLIASEAFEAVGVADVNSDGFLDLMSGGFWYEGPDFTRRHVISDVSRAGEYYNDFGAIPLDVTGNGLPDLITGGVFNQRLVWKENPGDDGGEWPVHVMAEGHAVETVRAWDIDNDGHVEIVPNLLDGPLTIFRLKRDGDRSPTGAWESRTIFGGPQGHGLGFGDVDGDGRGDFILSNGWLQAPEDPWNDAWTFHADFDLGIASVPVIVCDVNGDGLADLIVGQAHDYGLDWYEQRRSSTGERAWLKHPIDPFNSQYHEMLWVDIDGDGENELVTGKRFRAHNDVEPGVFDDIGLVYFKWNGEGFTKQPIAYGPHGIGKGTGLVMAAADLRGTGRLDIVTAGKDGLVLFCNEGT